MAFLHATQPLAGARGRVRCCFSQSLSGWETSQLCGNSVLTGREIGDSGADLIAEQQVGGQIARLVDLVNPVGCRRTRRRVGFLYLENLERSVRADYRVRLLVCLDLGLLSDKARNAY